MRILLGLLLLLPLFAQQKFNNIRVLKVPEDQVIEYMLAVNEALDVQCTFCHDPHAFAADDYKTKETARMMLAMARDINSKFPDGKRHVSCYTCHRGMTEPAMEPPAAPAQ